MPANKTTVIFFRLFYFSILIAIIIYFLVHIFFSNEKPTESPETTQIIRATNEFGFYSDSLVRFENTVNRNETLSDILEVYALAGFDITEIARTSREIFDVRKIRPGKTYHAFTNGDSLNTLKYFVYEKDPIHYVVYNLSDSLNIYEGEKKIITKENVKSAKIDHSLYVALMEADASPELAIKLSQIYAWQIDFYHLQKGDNFNVIYEEQFVDSQFVGIGKIIGAVFNHNSKNYFAIPFSQDSILEYFDEDGNSLRKAFLKSPLDFGRISSRYSKRRLHPVLHTYRPHLGVDYAAPVGTPVKSTGDGIVVEASYSNGNGKYIKIRHNSVYSTQYLHLSKYAKGLKRGTSVRQGQVIGYVGSTGLSTGPHLDYRFYINGKPVDPLKVELPPSHPVKDSLMNEFELVKNDILMRLQSSVSGDKVKDPA